MDETEFQAYLDAIDKLDTRFTVRENDGYVLEQLRDELGYRVDGCFYTKPSQTDN